jgi:hypothetical protein
MKLERDMFGLLVPSKTIKVWHVPLPSTLALEIRDRALRVKSDETKHTSGGYQNWICDAADRLTGDVLEVDYLFIGRTFRAAYTPSGGGWENTAQSILQAIRTEFKLVDPYAD